MYVRAIIPCALAAMIGCTHFAPPQAITPACFASEYACSGQVIARNPEVRPPVRVSKKTNPAAKTPDYTMAGKMRPAVTTQKEPESGLNIDPKTEASKIDSLAPSDNEIKDKSDPILEQAKATIAATMENPASAEFREMRRSVRNTLGQAIDAICGFVKGKTASGKDIDEKQFVYIVRLGEAYIVDNSGDELAPAAYRFLCN